MVFSPLFNQSEKKASFKRTRPRDLLQNQVLHQFDGVGISGLKCHVHTSMVRPCEGMGNVKYGGRLDPSWNTTKIRRKSVYILYISILYYIILYYIILYYIISYYIILYHIILYIWYVWNEPSWRGTGLFSNLCRLWADHFIQARKSVWTCGFSALAVAFSDT